MVYEDTGRHDEAMKLYLETEKFLISKKEEPTFLSDVYIGIAHIYKYKQDFDQAEKYTHFEGELPESTQPELQDADEKPVKLFGE